MNLDFALVNRALLNIAMAPVTEADKMAGNEAWNTAKEYYFNTFLEAIAQADWTGARRRRELCPAQMPYKKNDSFAHAYALPIDCARAIELDGQEYFETVANLLYTNAGPCRSCLGCGKCLNHTGDRPHRLFCRHKRHARLFIC